MRQDRQQNANITLVAQSPKFSNNFARMVGTGWTLSTTIVARSGGPFQVVTGVNPDPATGTGGNSSSQRPNRKASHRTLHRAQGSPGPASGGSFQRAMVEPGRFHINAWSPRTASQAASQSAATGIREPCRFSASLSGNGDVALSPPPYDPRAQPVRDPRGKPSTSPTACGREIHPSPRVPLVPLAQITTDATPPFSDQRCPRA